MKKNYLLAGIFFLFLTQSFAQYCVLPGRTPYSSLQPGITNFMLNTINRTSSNSESASSVVVSTGLSTTLTAGQTYTISISHSEDSQFFAGDRNNLRVWIDYNMNFSWTDAGETVLLQDLQPPATTFTATFTVPLTVPSGTYALRATAKMSADAGHTLPTPCDMPADPLGYHGEMEDYSVVIVNSGAPAVSFVISPTVCILSSLTVTNNSTGTPAPTYSWSSNPSTGVVFSPNATATNPQISFSSAGSHTITCVASNSVTSGSSSKVVNVNNCNFVGIHENEILDGISLFPNPASGTVNLELPGNNSFTELSLVNYLGQVLITKDLQINQNRIILNLSDFASGIYFVQLHAGRQQSVKRLIITN